MESVGLRLINSTSNGCLYLAEHAKQVVRFATDISLRVTGGMVSAGGMLIDMIGKVAAFALTADSALLVFNGGRGLGSLKGCDPGTTLSFSFAEGCGNSLKDKVFVWLEKIPVVDQLSIWFKGAPMIQQIYVIATAQLVLALSVYLGARLAMRVCEQVKEASRELNDRYCGVL